MKKVLIGIVVIPVLLIALVVGWFYNNQKQMFQDPVFDKEPPAVTLNDDQPALLVFSKTNGFRHGDGIPAGNKLLTQIADRKGWQIFLTENGAVHNSADLARFDVVIWANASGPLLLPQQREALQAFIQNGGGFIAIHAAGDNSHSDWDWYQNSILGTGFIGHTMMPHKQDADIVRAKTHPVMAGLPERWSHYDEWYAFDKNPDLAGATVIANVDEASYDPGKYSMSPTHPVIWVKDIGEGRSLYSALGHSEKSFETPEYQQLLAQAIAWTGRLEQQEKP